MTKIMPAEWREHERTWMAFPSNGYTLGDSDADREAARKTWANVANAVSEFEPVNMVVNPGDEAIARRLLSGEIELLSLPLDDAWMRDIGPTFVIEDGKLAGVDWTFNGWGASEWATWDADAKIAGLILKELGVPGIPSELVNEGGGIHVDGSGTVLLTKTVQLGAERNPGWTKQAVEKEIAEKIGADSAIWIERGLTRDYDEFGTRGHIDIVACFRPDGKVLYHHQTNTDHPDWFVSREVARKLGEHGLDAIGVPAPETLKDAEGFVDYSYINHYVVNAGVILCSFGDQKGDLAAKEIIEDSYPGRDVKLVDARELFARGGGIHCITQQQPKV